MGLEQSSLNKTKIEINSMYDRFQAERLILESKIQMLLSDLHKASNDEWIPKQMNALILKNRHIDGSSVKELCVPEWNVAFYNSGDGVQVRDYLYKGDIGKTVTISEENSIILHSLWIKSYQARSIGVLVQPVLQHYLTADQVPKF